MSFDYLSIIDHLSNNYSAYIEIRTLKQDEMFSNKIIVDGENFNDKFIGFIVKQAKSRRLDGSITLLIENKLSLICTTYYKNYIDWLCKQIKNYKKGNAKIEFIQIEEFNNQLTWNVNTKLNKTFKVFKHLITCIQQVINNLMIHEFEYY